MPLQPGITLGPYTVTAKIGEGGMGEVYQARDTKLDRDVALKVLPEAFTSDPDRLARFEREAKVLASLNHPNIGSIYGLEEAEGVKALVLELVEGPTLADRIKQGPIPVDEALPIAKQIAEALEAAHEAGVIHRDLKPANVKVKDDDTVKVLDFGLAKAFQTDASDPSLSQSPTISLTAAATQMGMVIGTAAYMAPEQASGKAVDKRADVWAFGVVFYEMLTGTRPFVGDDVSKTLAHVIAIDPDWTRLPKTVPPVLGTFLRGCLEKDPRKRVRDIGDVGLAMEGTFEPAITARSVSGPVPLLGGWRRSVSLVLLVLFVVLATGLAVWSLMRPAPPQVTRFSIELSAGEQFLSQRRHVIAIAPNGTHVVYATTDQLYLRAMDEVQATPIRGTDGAREPFFSFDGRWIGFTQQRELKKVSVSGGAPVSLGEAGSITIGASWEADDTILLGQGPLGIWQASGAGAGGTPEALLEVQEGEEAQTPQMLPNGEWVLFTLKPSGVTAWDDAQIVVQSLETGERRVLINGGRDARYVSTGHLVYAVQGTLYAIAFDPDTLTVAAGPVPLVEVVAVSGGSGAAHFSLSDTGSLVYVPGAGGVGAESVLGWVDRNGQMAPLTLTEGNGVYRYPRLSPDGRQVALWIGSDIGDVWLYDLERDSPRQLTVEGANYFPVWTPDGTRVTFSSTRSNGRFNLYWKPADGSGEAESLRLYPSFPNGVST